VAFAGSYHGLSYAPLAACGLRASYREPFLAQLNPWVRFVDYPASEAQGHAVLGAIEEELVGGGVGAVLFEPILGRGGCIVPPPGFLSELVALAHRHGALAVADEIWTGLGRSGQWLYSTSVGAQADLVCLAKGLGGGIPVSACIGSAELMQAWSREHEVVHTSTFAGAPLACAAALATLTVLERERLVERAALVGERLFEALSGLREAFDVTVHGRGLMLGIELGTRGAAVRVARGLLERGYLVSTGGGQRDALVLTPPLNIPEALLFEFVPVLRATLEDSVR
jgi:4-aminobutyrate aminotransferase / (S)-3-amino-2-methylpropionate transaminase / 5-aminovalerate transaminase